MCVADAFHISDSHSLSVNSVVLNGSCKTDIPLTWLLMSKSVVLAYSSSLSTLGYPLSVIHSRLSTLGYPLSDGPVSIVFFWCVVTSLSLS